MIKFKFIGFLTACLLISSCLQVKIFTENQGLKDFNLKQNKLLIVTNDTEVSQEFLISLKNYLLRGLKNEGVESHAVNVRYSTKANKNAAKKSPIVIFKAENEPKTSPYSKIKPQIYDREIMPEDAKLLTDSVQKILPNVILDINVQHERRVFYPSVMDSKASQSFKSGSYSVVLKSVNDNTIYWKGELFVGNLSNGEMIQAARQAASDLIKKFKISLIIK